MSIAYLLNFTKNTRVYAVFHYLNFGTARNFEPLIWSAAMTDFLYLLLNHHAPNGVMKNDFLEITF
jgi:hypothetical protein